MNPVSDPSRPKKSLRGFSFKVYSSDLNALNLTLNQLRAEVKNKVSVFRMPVKRKTHQVPNNPHGEGYRTYSKVYFQIRRALITGKDLRVLPVVKRILRAPGVYNTLTIK